MDKSQVHLASDGDPRLAALIDEPLRALLALLLERFAARADALLAARDERQQQVDAGRMPGFADDDRAGDWHAAGGQAALRDRRVELAAPAVAEDLLTALDAGTSSVAVDLATALTGEGGALQAHLLLDDLLRDRLEHPRRPALVFGLRPPTAREPALRWRDEAVPAAIADLALCLRHAATTLAARGGGIFLRLSGLDSADEAALWAEILDSATEFLDLDESGLRVTLGCDSVHAVFAAEAMLRALKRWADALTFDRHACLRSFVHTFRRHPQFVLPDPDELTTTTHFLRCRGLHLIAVAHRRGASALAPTLLRLPPPANGDGRDLARLKADLERHARDGFDGVGIVHPALLAEAREVYERLVPGPHQRHRGRSDVRITAADLLQVVKGKITERGMRRNLEVAMSGYLAVRDGSAKLDLEGRRETAASISLAADQLWQWVHHETGVLDDGRIVDAELFAGILEQVRAASAHAADDAREAAAALEAYVIGRQQPGEFPADLLPG